MTTYLSDVQSNARQIGKVVLGESVLEHDRRLNFEELVDEFGRISGVASELGQNVDRVVIALLHQEPAGSLREENHSDAQDETGDDLNGERQSPRCRGLAGTATGRNIIVRVEGALAGSAAGVGHIRSTSWSTDVVGTVIDPVTDENSNSDGQLLEHDETPTNFSNGDLEMGSAS